MIWPNDQRSNDVERICHGLLDNILLYEFGDGPQADITEQPAVSWAGLTFVRAVKEIWDRGHAQETSADEDAWLRAWLTKR